MDSGWRTRRRNVSSRMKQPGLSDFSEREEHLRAVARMHRPKLVRRELPPANAAVVSKVLLTEEAALALMKDGGMPPELAALKNLSYLQHEAEDNDEIILCRILGGIVTDTARGTSVSYNPQSAQTIPDWPKCIALEPEGVHARRAYRKNIITIQMMIDTTEIEPKDVIFVCAPFFVIRSRNINYLCHGQFRYPVEAATISYEVKCISFDDRSSIVVNEIGIFDFYLTAYYRSRFWLDLA
jgi:hypothetical protein